MAINRVEIEDFLVFKGEFSTDFCPGVNVIIGGNGTGKTTLLKCLYDLKRSQPIYPSDVYDFDNIGSFEDGCVVVSEPKSVVQKHIWGTAYLNRLARNYIYIPEKDILEHAKGLLPFIEQKSTGFSHIYKDALVNAQDIPTNKQTELQRSTGSIIASIIGGYIEWVQSEGSFYTVHTDGVRIPFASEASGFKKLGYLGLLIASGQIDTGTVLFWDEPENSLNRELMPDIVDVLLTHANNGVQMFFATHDYHLARYFDVRKNKNIPVAFYRLAKSDSGKIECASSSEYTKLTGNPMESASEKLYASVISDAFGVNDNE